MPRRPAKVTQADANRYAMAAKQAGMSAIVIHPDGAWSGPNGEDLSTLPVTQEPKRPIINPRVISKDEAVARSGLTMTQFNAMIDEGLFPKRITGTRGYDRKALYAQFERLEIKTNMVAPGFVYFMEMGDFIKIGFSQGPVTRRESLQIGNPYEIKILASFIGSKDNEAELHARFTYIRTRGEWFKRTKGLLAYIAWLQIVTGKARHD